MAKSREYSTLENKIEQTKAALGKTLKTLEALEDWIDQLNFHMEGHRYSLITCKNRLKQLKLRKKYGDISTSFEWEQVFDDIDDIKSRIKENKRLKKKYISQRKSIIRKLSKRLK